MTPEEIEQIVERVAGKVAGRNIDHELARYYHTRADNDATTIEAMLVEFSQTAIRAVALAGAAGIAGLFGLWSANSGTGGAFPLAIKIGLIAFGAAVCCSVVTSGLAYLTQFMYAKAQETRIPIWEYPWVEWPEDEKKWRRRAEILHWACVVVIISSYACILAGVISFAFIDFGGMA